MKTIQKAKTIAVKAKESYQAPTPIKWQKVGNAIQDISVVVAGVSVFTANPVIPFIALCVGKLGKIITDFAS